MATSAQSEEAKQKQRQKQQEALKRQAAGGLTKRELKRRRAAGEPLPKLPPKEKDSKRSKPEHTVERTRPQHDLVIIPIFWRNVYGQEESMVEEALRIKNILQKFGKLDVWVDRTHKLTPGQKLNFWESQGVSWRVEIGPKEAAKHKCVISRQAGVAGDYSTVTKVANVSTIRQGELLAKLRGNLSLLKIPDESIVRANNDKAGDEEQLIKSKKNLLLMERERNEEDVQQQTSEVDHSDPSISAGEMIEKPLNAKERRALRRQQSSHE